MNAPRLQPEEWLLIAVTLLVLACALYSIETDPHVPHTLNVPTHPVPAPATTNVDNDGWDIPGQFAATHPIPQQQASR